ncbi:MAG: hypothetical protein Q7J44_15680 [Pseudotabrizicola sp.]|uniref:hypothetical protein n=1 Tax=Pseudotabrizicola sp. TaxID=2939647 RepID=UPI00272600A0|nr:hypothetical protein [Pseudotabrizicola sp.]MDO9639977.1 hypothetical protein [Pseudotabrizicola sp.]
MITLVTTIGNLPADRRDPVLAALRANLALAAVSEIVVLTEGRPDWYIAAAASAGASGRVRIEHTGQRPTFADLFTCANHCLTHGAQAVAMLNADISLADDGSAARLTETLAAMAGEGAPVVFALTRHDPQDGELALTLYDGNGLPNTLSADAWAFCQPLHLTRDLFYCPGQMNCDMLLTHDLLGSGCEVFNPCLDIVLQHHEQPKDDAYYREVNADETSQEILWRHTKQNAVYPWNYFGNPWVSTRWLRAGYRPAPASTNRPRIYMAVPAGLEHALAAHLAPLCALADRHACEVMILCDADPDRIIAENLAVLAEYPAASVLRPCDGVAALRCALLNGDHGTLQSLAFVADIDRIDAALLAEVEGVFLTLTANTLPAPVALGCTLMTSVFRADAFMNGFLTNCTRLDGYGSQIEHVFLVSTLTAHEAGLLDAHLSRYPTATVLWFRKDPGLYACWNIGIRVARTPYVSNANVDDLRDPAHVATLVAQLDSRPEVLVAASALNPFYVFPDDGTLPDNRDAWYADRPGAFGFCDLATLTDQSPPGLEPFNLPHCMPVWRRALHARFGWFDEGRYGTFADWAFWLKVLQGGGSGWLDPAPLGFYFVNPTSHNRRGTDLDRLHKVVEDEFLPLFLARRSGAQPKRNGPPAGLPRKLCLGGTARDYGQHRNNFNALVNALTPLEIDGEDGVQVIPFLERQFVWGDAEGEARSPNPCALTRPWIGILHVPFETPDWFEPATRPETFLTSALFRQSLPACRGILTLAQDLEADLNRFLPGVATLSVKHPTRYDARLFDPSAYRAAPAVVQVGDWLRRLQAIHRLRAPGHRRIMLLKQWTTAFLQRDIAVFGDQRDPGVEMVAFVPNARYDALLSSSVVLCLLYGTAANNVVIECIARATPILINPLPAVMEYLGADYPLYVTDEAGADRALATPGLVEAAHQYLLQRRAVIDLSYEGFCHAVAQSAIYEALQTAPCLTRKILNS